MGKKRLTKPTPMKNLSIKESNTYGKKIPFICNAIWMALAAVFLILIGLSFNGCTRELNIYSPPVVDKPQANEYTFSRDLGVVDFAFVENDGTYHLIGIDPAAAFTVGDTTKYGFFHATSTDLENWIEHSNITHITEGVDATWAPSIIKVNNTWVMYYTSVENVSSPARKQYISIVFSEDLFEWTRPLAVLEGHSEFTTYGTGIDWADDFRDCHVFNMDNNVLGMVVSARSSENPMVMTIVRASSPPYLVDWTIDSEFENIRSPYAESSFMLIHEGDEYLFWTPNNGTCQVLRNGEPTYSRYGGKACEILPKGDGSYWFAYLEITNWVPVGNQMIPKFGIKIETLLFDDNGDLWSLNRWKKEVT